ncbi:MAG: TonB-dependent receptor [Bacteroides sp.]|nr:TonB-dependent receptor [Bacteroides sp.]
MDKSTGSSLPNAHVCFESLDKEHTSYCLSDKNGSLDNSVNKRSLISVSFVGFQTLLDTIDPGESLRLYLLPSMFDMDEVVVTAQFSPKRLDQSIYKVKVIGNSSVESKGATNLSELISNELNFSPVRDAALGSSVRIQGLGGEHVKILVDGVPMVGRQNGILDLGQINVSSIDHIEIVEGPMSVVYGSNAMAGVINIITKENHRQSLTAGIEGYYETVGVYDLDANFSLNRGKSSMGLSAGRYFFDGYSEVENSRAMEWNPKLQYNLDGYYALNLGSWKTKLSSSYFSEELRDKGAVNPNLNYEGAFDYYHFTNRWANTLDVVKQLGRKQNLKLTGAYSWYRKAKISYLNDLVNLEKIVIPTESANDTTTFHNYFSRGTYSNEQADKISYQGGYEFNYETAISERLEGTESIGDISGFLSLNLSPYEKLNFQPGLRYIYNFNYKSPLVYSFNVKWDVVHFLRLRASYAKGFRAPSIKELYLDFQDINHNIMGNPDLEAETGHNFNFWFDFSFSKNSHNFQLSNNIYYNKIENKIELLYDQEDPTAAIYFNVPAGAMISKGFSSDFTYKFHPRFTLNAGVYHNELSSIINTSEFTSNTDYTTNFKYKNVKYRFELSLFYKYTDIYTRYVGSMDMETGEIYDVSLSYLDAYHNMDVTFSIPVLKDALRLTTGVKNIFDNKSINSSGGGAVHSGGSSGSTLLNWGRTVFFKVSYQFVKFKKHGK